MIIYCKTCLNPSTRPNSSFNSDGLCTVCEFENNKKVKGIDWKSRRKEINKIKLWGQKNTKSVYDCIVTVSGGKDSIRQAFYARDDLGMNPLLISVQYPPEQIHDRGANNISKLISGGFTCITFTVDPIKYKELCKHNFFNFGNWGRHSEMVLFAYPLHAAVAFDIPLVFYGENPLYTMGEKEGGFGGDATGLAEGNTVRGGTNSLNFDNATEEDYHFYNIPSLKDMKRAKLKLVYLGYYIEDWYGFRNAEFAKKIGFKKRNEPPEIIGDLWGVTAVDEEFRIVNQFLKYYKLGYGCVTDQVCEAIHQGKINRNEAIDLVNKYDGVCDLKYIKNFCKYLDISLSQFWEVLDKFVNKDLFEKHDGKWKPKFKVG